MKNNAQLQRDVLDELLWDPSINPANIEVAADSGSVTLSGSIGSYSEKTTAERDARRVCGVVSVVDNLDVEFPPAYMRTDADLAGAAKDALRWNGSVPHERISVATDNGVLTLTGEVAYQFQREAASEAVRFLVGAKGISNGIKITPSVRCGGVKRQIEQALVRNAETDARSIRVEAYDGKVILRGTVHSWAEYRGASRAAWAAPGVLEVGPTEVMLLVADDGRGFDPSAARPGHFGLQLMREHAMAIGGALDLVSAPGRGTQVPLRVVRRRQ